MTYKGAPMMSEYQDWQTPQTLVDWISSRFKVDFDLDVCATKESAKCAEYYTVEDNALEQIWTGNCWMNPPYNDQLTWISRAIVMTKMGYAKSVYALIPARTDTKLFHEQIKTHATKIYFIKGRVNFNRSNRKSNTGSTHPSMLVVFQGRHYRPKKRTRQRRGARMTWLDVPAAARRGQR